jgi:predicted Na+-dependent transporter
MLKILIPITIFTIMLGLGMGLRSKPTERLLRTRPWLCLRGLAGTCLLVPLAALLVLHLPAAQAVPRPVQFGITLMALCPSAPLTLRKAGLKGGEREMAAVLQVGGAVAAVVSIPLMAALFRTMFQVQGWQILPRQVALNVGVLQLLPLLLGFLVRRRTPRLAARLEGPVEKTAILLLLVLVAVILVITAYLLATFVREELVAIGFMAVMVALSLAIGYLLAGPRRSERITLSLVTSMRNPGLALLFASLFAPEEPSIKVTIVVYLLLTVLLTAPFLRWQQGIEAGAAAA